VPGVPCGQEGRAATVYKLAAAGGDPQALKVFKPRYRLPGLAICRRAVLSARRHRELLRRYPDLTYGVLMPWVEGPTWMQVLGRSARCRPRRASTWPARWPKYWPGWSKRG